jgi:superfamily II DNA/RNA helicase
VSDGGVPPTVRGLLAGRRHAPVPAGVAHKYLVFAMHSESARQIAAALAALGAGLVLLRGTRKQKDAAVRRFKGRGARSVNLMIATSSRDCAGLHLPEVTRLVLYHHHGDRHIAEQAVGRAQRVGREHSLEVIELLNEGEAERFG